MARLIPRFSQHQPYTHVIIDLPIFLTIQDCYLRNCLGKDAVNFCNVDSNEIIPGKINLVSIADDQTLNSLKNLAPTIFIATWSLSETNETTVNKILQLNYCNASYLCFGFRHYEHINPRQPMSDALQIPKGYETLVKSPVFYAGAKEQYYWISKRT